MIEPAVFPDIDRPAAEVTAALAAYGVATIHEAAHRTGLMLPKMRPLSSGSRVCGPAVTALNVPGDNLMVHVALSVVQPGDVLVLAATGPTEHGIVGELLVTQAEVRGVAGMVIDAAVRDTAEIREMGFPVWASAVSALGSVKQTPGWVNVAVECAGAIVHPGDLVVGDDDGVVVVPRADAVTVLAAAEAREAKEAALRQRYRAGESSLDVYDLRGLVRDLTR